MVGEESVMDIQSLKKHIHDEHKIEYVLSSLGCHDIKHDIKRECYYAAHKDGDNPKGVVIYDNDYLNYISYSRNVTPNDRQDIVNLIQYTNKINFVDALKWLHKILDITWGPYVKPIKKRNMAEEILSVFTNAVKPRNIVDAEDIHEIDEEAINDYIPMLHIDWWKEGIMPWTQKKFGLCYSYKHNRMVVPLRYWADGSLLGFNQRTMVPDWKEFGISKYFTTPSYQKRLNLYGLWENKEAIEREKICIIVEAEKSVLKMDSILKEIGRNNQIIDRCNFVALQGKSLSDEQLRIILSLNIKEIVIALDNDVCLDEIRFLCEKFYMFRNVSYIKDRFKLLDEKDSPCDKGKKVYEYLFNHRISYDKFEHEKYLKSLNNR